MGDYMEHLQLATGGGALIGVAVTNYLAGSTGVIKKLLAMLPAGNAGLILLNGAGGVAVMNLAGGAPLDARTVMYGAGAAVVYHVAVGMLSADMQATLNGTK